MIQASYQGGRESGHELSGVIAGEQPLLDVGGLRGLLQQCIEYPPLPPIAVAERLFDEPALRGIAERRHRPRQRAQCPG